MLTWSLSNEKRILKSLINFLRKLFMTTRTPTKCMPCSTISSSPTSQSPPSSFQTDLKASLEMDRQMGGKERGGWERHKEGRRRGIHMTHFAEPRVFLEVSVLIGEPLGEQQHWTGALLLVLHLCNLFILAFFAFFHYPLPPVFDLKTSSLFVAPFPPPTLHWSVTFIFPLPFNPPPSLPSFYLALSLVLPLHQLL